MEVNEIRNKLAGKSFALICDTDGEGIMLCSAMLELLLKFGIPEEEIAVISHFDTKGLATTGRGDVVGVIRALRGLGIKHIILMDVPAVSEDFVKEVAELTKESKVIIIDHIMHGYYKYLSLLQRLAKRENLELRLTLSTPQKFLTMMQIMPSASIYEKAVMATISESDFKALSELNILRALVPDEEREKLSIVNIDFVKDNYPAFLAFDTYLKFGNFSNVKTNITAIGNAALKVVYFAQVPMATAIEEALQRYSPPDVSSYIKVEEFVAVVDRLAPRGQGFKQAAYIASKTGAPFILTLAEGFESDKTVMIIAPNNFVDDGEVAAAIIRDHAKQIHDMLMQQGYSTEKDFPRGDAAVAIGVLKGKEPEAVKEVTKFLNSKYSQIAVEKVAAKVAVDILSMVIADKPLIAAMVKAFEEAMKRILSACKK